MSYFSKSLVAAAAIVASATSFAAPVTLAEDTIAGDFTIGNTATQTFRAVINGKLSTTTKAGEIGVTGLGLSSFAAYCYDPTVTLSLPGSYNVSEVALDGVARLFKVSGFNGLAYGTDGVDTVTKTVALQLAIWEVALDGLAGADLMTGHFSFDPSVTRIASNGAVLHATVNSDAYTLAGTYLSQASALTGGYYPNVRLFTPAEGTTNQALVTTVPEPSTYALMAACLGVVGFVARRKSA
jgi:hypothetical protein